MNSRGFSYLELLMVISIMLILGVVSMPFIANTIQINNQRSTVDVLVSTLRKAQAYSLAGKNQSVWGVCLYQANIRLYTSSCNSPVFKEDFSLPGNVTITGLSGVTFSSGRGEPSSAIGVTVASDTRKNLIQVNAAGGFIID